MHTVTVTDDRTGQYVRLSPKESLVLARFIQRGMERAHQDREAIEEELANEDGVAPGRYEDLLSLLEHCEQDISIGKLLLGVV